MDEVGTPDSSRIWDGEQYRAGTVVENSKEGFRQLLLKHLHKAGAKLIVTDINQQALNKASKQLGATVVALDEIYHQDVDVYSPCALGATINDDTIKCLQAKIIAGCANNQLSEPRHDQALIDNNILYAPDYVINAGGMINISFEEDYCVKKATKKVGVIYDTLLDIFAKADERSLPTGVVADDMARTIIKQGSKNK
jgi:leucine dehydrogenase